MLAMLEVIRLLGEGSFFVSDKNFIKAAECVSRFSVFLACKGREAKSGRVGKEGVDFSIFRHVTEMDDGVSLSRETSIRN